MLIIFINKRKEWWASFSCCLPFSLPPLLLLLSDLNFLPILYFYWANSSIIPYSPTRHSRLWRLHLLLPLSLIQHHTRTTARWRGKRERKKEWIYNEGEREREHGVLNEQRCDRGMEEERKHQRISGGIVGSTGHGGQERFLFLSLLSSSSRSTRPFSLITIDLPFFSSSSLLCRNTPFQLTTSCHIHSRSTELAARS